MLPMNANIAIAEAVTFYESAPDWFLLKDLRQAHKNGTPNAAHLIEYVLNERHPNTVQHSVLPQRGDAVADCILPYTDWLAVEDTLLPY
jgi:hypothetical protein